MTVPSINEIRHLVMKHTEALYNEAVLVFGTHGLDLTDEDQLILKAGQDHLAQGLINRYQRKAEAETAAAKAAEARQDAQGTQKP